MNQSAVAAWAMCETLLTYPQPSAFALFIFDLAALALFTRDCFDAECKRAAAAG
jgi:hypothetical protein